MNTSNCESVKVQIQDSLGSSTMDDVRSSSLEITGEEGQNISSNNIESVPGADLQAMGAWPSKMSQSFRDIIVNRGVCHHRVRKYIICKSIKKVTWAMYVQLFPVRHS